MKTFSSSLDYIGVTSIFSALTKLTIGFSFSRYLGDNWWYMPSGSLSIFNCSLTCIWCDVQWHTVRSQHREWWSSVGPSPRRVHPILLFHCPKPTFCTLHASCQVVVTAACSFPTHTTMCCWITSTISTVVPRLVSAIASPRSHLSHFWPP